MGAHRIDGGIGVSTPASRVRASFGTENLECAIEGLYADGQKCEGHFQGPLGGIVAKFRKLWHDHSLFDGVTFTNNSELKSRDSILSKVRVSSSALSNDAHGGIYPTSTWFQM